MYPNRCRLRPITIERIRPFLLTSRNFIHHGNKIGQIIDE